MIKTTEFSWDLNKVNPMMIDIKLNGQLLFNLFVGEAMELIGRELIMKHVAEIEKSPWIKNWHPPVDNIIKPLDVIAPSTPINVLMIESERGWGQKIDSIKSFATKEEADEFITKFNSRNTSETVPEWYMYAILETDCR